MRVEAGRRVFGAIWFDESSTEDGRDALGWYHEKKSDDDREALMGRNTIGPLTADAFGLMCVSYEDPARAAGFNRPINYPRQGVA
jgi:phage terminase large subunit